MLARLPKVLAVDHLDRGCRCIEFVEQPSVDAIRRVVPSQLPSDLKSGLSLKVPQPQVAQKLWATFLVCQR